MKYSYKPLGSNLTISKSNIHGFGLFALEDIKPYTDLGTSHYKIKNQDHPVRTPLGGFINHSKTPNCSIALNVLKREYECYYLYSITNINKGEELTLDYTKEWYKIENIDQIENIDKDFYNIEFID